MKSSIFLLVGRLGLAGFIAYNVYFEAGAWTVVFLLVLYLLMEGLALAYRQQRQELDQLASGKTLPRKRKQ